MRLMKNSFFLLVSAALVACSSCGGEKQDDNNTVENNVKMAENLTYKLVSNLPHDTNAFTEGLFVHEGQLYESTGAPTELPQTRSLFGLVDMKSGKIAVKAELDKKIYFGEGIALLNNKIYQLTYKNKKGFVYDAKTYQKISEFAYDNAEGWGMTTDGKNLIMSDGSHTLTFIDPATMKATKSLDVTLNGLYNDRLNELEYINGFIYANVFTTNNIVKIDPKTGEVVGIYDFSNLVNEMRASNPKALEMNGIAYDAQAKKVYITGKMWPKLFEVALD